MLPRLPSPTKIVGHPSPDSQTLYVSKADMVELMAYVVGLQGWIRIATTCLEDG